jgi:hypothetical protein
MTHSIATPARLEAGTPVRLALTAGPVMVKVLELSEVSGTSWWLASNNDAWMTSGEVVRCGSDTLVRLAKAAMSEEFLTKLAAGA